MARIDTEMLRSIRTVDIDEGGNVVFNSHSVLETDDAINLATELSRLAIRIHTAALEWEPAPFTEPGPFAVAHVPVPDIAGGDVR